MIGVSSGLPIETVIGGDVFTSVTPGVIPLLSQLTINLAAALGDAIRLFGWFAIALYLLINALYFVIHTAALPRLQTEHRFSQWNEPYEAMDSPFLPGVAVIIPAYNEEEVILDCVQSSILLEYSDRETVVVNDGSDDETLAVLIEEFDMQPIPTDCPIDFPTEPVHDVYRSTTDTDLYVIDKDNGGRSDAVNAGVWFTDMELFCTIDADTILDKAGLSEVVKPFLRNWGTVIATGGTVRVANGTPVDEGEIEEPEFPRGFLPSVQVLEYLRSFYSGRIGLDTLESLIILSGAFGVFRTDLVRDIGGYRTDTLTEDLDLVLRLHKTMIDSGEDYEVSFVPAPVAWTEVPETLSVFVAQRRRWYNGLLENLITHREMMFNPKYGPIGLFALPFFLIAEAIGPLVEGIGYVLLPIAVLLGIFEPASFLLFFTVTSGFGIFLSWYATYGEVWTFRRYRKVSQVVQLMVLGVLENVGYRQLRTFIKITGLPQFVRGNTEWGEMVREGFDD
ncbi:N-glycosyltransferase [Halolamina pelagica]|uniref:N-glycosyltransferase n=1 Tax=Halolamina pelagica TaxID=699431 RepID=A0A0P7G849_9EURY|nr:glycosyltransferase [Halolamina pelagica]KPN29431.1 N-glycosyltransferase [Halolamina pelagica]